MNPAEQEQFLDLYRTYKRVMLGTAYNILHNKQDAEDAVQKAMEKILKVFPRTPKEKNAGTKSFYITVTKNAAISLYNQNHRAQLVEYNDEVLSGAYAQQPDDFVIGREDMDDLCALIRTLPDSITDVFELRYLHGLNDKEISELLIITENTVRTRIYRGKQKLRELLQEYKERGGAHETV